MTCSTKRLASNWIGYGKALFSSTFKKLTGIYNKHKLIKNNTTFM